MSEFKRLIPLFVIGSTELKEEREKLASAILDLNSDIEPKIHFRMRTWYHYKNNQDEYNDYIENQAEIIIVLIHKKLSDESRKEIRRANVQMHKTGKPRVILTFISQDTDFTQADGAFVKGICSVIGQNGDYWIPYSDATDLASKAKEELRKYIKSASVRSVLKPRRRPYLVYIQALIMVMVLSVFFLGTYNKNHLPTSAILMITGGGSAVNYINRYFPEIDINSYPEGYFVHMPSGDTWRLLVEEVTSPIAISRKRYIPICLSASRYNEKDLLETITMQDFIKKGSMIEFFLGNDTLEVQLKNEASVLADLKSASLSQRQISSDELRDILNGRIGEVNVFTTSPHSGTKYAYAKALMSPDFNLYKYDVLRYEEDSELPHIVRDGKPYIILGSKCYYVKQMEKLIENEETLVLNFVDSSTGHVLVKPIYFYCMAYREDDTNTLKIPQQTLNFLHYLHVDLGKKVNRNGYIRRKTDQKVLIDFKEDLLDW